MNIVIKTIDCHYKEITTKDCDDREFVMESIVCTYEAYIGHKDRIIGSIMLDGKDIIDTAMIEQKVRDSINNIYPYNSE